MRRMVAVLTLPSRLALLIPAVLAVVVAALRPAAAGEGGLVGASQMVGGVAILVILFGWRWFWRGLAVQERMARDARKTPPL